MIRNPILPGFNPDPSICRVGADYFIATSTFEWYPGVQIHHSRNLIDWRLVSRPLTRASQLDMRGNPDSCGVWAPCLSHHNGCFWLVYTDVKRLDGNFKDAHNYIVTSDSITGPWSDPVYVNSSGFDPSLFHDEDGRQWFLNMVWNHRASGVHGSLRESLFGGILIQEFDAEHSALVGRPALIFAGSDRGLTEAPHLFRHDGWYYLIVAEGGTGYEHAVTHARSRHVTGPYELHPDTHVMTGKDAPAGELQRAGHGQVVTTPDGEVYHTLLCSRPLTTNGAAQGCSPLGRETAIQRCVWGDDGWLRLAQGGQHPDVNVPAPHAAQAEDRDPLKPGEPGLAGDARPVHYFFEPPSLPVDFQWLRTPYPERLFSLDARLGCLSLYGRESVGSWFEQALVARRLQHLSVEVDTELLFAADNFQQGAGLVAYYNRHKFHLACVTHDEKLGQVLTVMSCDGDYPESRLTFPLPEPVALRAQTGTSPLRLRCRIDRESLQFFQAEAGSDWQPLGPSLDASLLSDEGGRGEHASFTGCFVGMLAFDVSGQACRADFSQFSYTPILP